MSSCKSRQASICCRSSSIDNEADLIKNSRQRKLWHPFSLSSHSCGEANSWLLNIVDQNSQIKNKLDESRMRRTKRTSMNVPQWMGAFQECPFFFCFFSVKGDSQFRRTVNFYRIYVINSYHSFECKKWFL